MAHLTANILTLQSPGNLVMFLFFFSLHCDETVYLRLIFVPLETNCSVPVFNLKIFLIFVRHLSCSGKKKKEIGCLFMSFFMVVCLDKPHGDG